MPLGWRCKTEGDGTDGAGSAPKAASLGAFSFPLSAALEWPLHSLFYVFSPKHVYIRGV